MLVLEGDVDVVGCCLSALTVSLNKSARLMWGGCSISCHLCKLCWTSALRSRSRGWSRQDRLAQSCQNNGKGESKLHDDDSAGFCCKAQDFGLLLSGRRCCWSCCWCSYSFIILIRGRFTTLFIVFFLENFRDYCQETEEYPWHRGCEQTKPS